MTNKITYANFIGDFHLDINTGETAVLDIYIEKYQKELFKILLGNNLYADFDLGMGETTPLAKWTNLLNGVSGYYTYNGLKYQYTGLKEMLTAYVYFWYNNLETTTSTPQGESKSTTNNGDVVINVNKQIRAYNRCVDLFNEAIDFINYSNSVDSTTYPEFDPGCLKYKNSFCI